MQPPSIESLVGADERSELFQDFLRAVGPHRVDNEIDDRVTAYCCLAAGLDVTACVKTRRVTTVVAYRAGAAPRYGEFLGQLPRGLSFRTTIEEVGARLGERAEDDGEGLRLPGPDYTLSTKFDKEGRLCRVTLFT